MISNRLHSDSGRSFHADRFKVSSEVVPPLRKPSLSELLKCTESGKLPCHFAVRPVLCTVNSFSSLEGSFFSGLSLPWWLDLFGLLGSVTHSRSRNDVRGGRARDLCTSKGPMSCCPSLTTAAPTPREKGEGHQGSKSWSLDPTGTRNNKSSPA